MRFFFYGTLLDAAVRARVARGDVAVEPARLRGWRRVAARGRPYPVVIRDPRGVVDGLLASGIDGRAAERLVEYEGPEYDIVTVRVERPGGRFKEALLFAARSPSVASARPWNLAAWQRAGGRKLIRGI